jgi:phospholipid/cholesterol/gamma-HCH transport system ATP-binding protein
MLGMTFVVVTHELPSIFRVARRVLLLDARVKTMVALDEPAKLRDSSPNEWVRSFFNREPTAMKKPPDSVAAGGGGAKGEST